MVLVVLAFAFWIWMLVDCATRNFRKENDKVIWILIILLANILGAFIYFFVVYPYSKR
ncbi:MAG: PLDc N-terminal domain-containing protein [Nanoarchaeota archaeon]